MYSMSHGLLLSMLSVVDSLLILNENIFFRQWHIYVISIAYSQFFTPVGSITDLPVKESYLTLPDETFSMSFMV